MEGKSKSLAPKKRCQALFLPRWEMECIPDLKNEREEIMKAIRPKKRTTFRILLLLGIVLSVLTVSVLRASGWSISTIENVGTVGSHSSIAIDSNDKVHISYLDQTDHDLKYVTNTPGSWMISTIDTVGDVGYFTSIATDSNNKVHISYCDVPNGGLKYATNASGLWEIFPIAEGDRARFTSIVIDSNNSIHISYFEYGHTNLKYATNASGSWETFIIDSEGIIVGMWTSIAIDSNNYAHISYYDETNAALKYATNASGSWETFAIDSAGEPTSLAVDSSNKVHISYRDTNGALKYATNISGPWETFTVDNAGYLGYYCSIAIDSDDKVHIGYFDNGNADLKYATNASGSWVTSLIDSLTVGAFPSIAIDSRNKVHLSYHDGTNGDLKYARNATEVIGLPYDDFSGVYINKDRWKQGEFVREIDVANHRLVNKLATPSPIVIETYPYKSTNDLIFYNPQSINSIQADVSILGKAVTNDVTVKATIGGRWYYYYVSELVGYVWAEIAIKEDSSGLKATWSVLSSLDPYFSVWETLGSGDFTTTIGISTTYTLSIGYDVDAHQFRFRVGTEEQTFGPAGLPDREGTGLDVLKFLLTEAEVGDSTSSAYISATFANVYVNDSLYEDFSSVLLDPTKWLIQHLTIDGNSDEFVREVSGESFRSKIRSRLSTTHVYNRLEFIDPPSIPWIRTKVTPLQYQNEDNQGAGVEAGIAGHFYNEGVSNMDYAGEVEAKIWIGGNWNGGGAIPAAHWWVRKFFDYEGTFSQILDQGTFVMPIILGNTYVLSLGWIENQLTFGIEDTVTEAFEEKTYVPGTSTNPSNMPWKGIGTFVYNPTNLEATIEALFDDVSISCTYISIGTHPQGQTIQMGQTATLSVSASGTAPLTYQWYQGQSGDTSTPVGTNSSSYTTPALTQARASYWVRVSNSCSSADSNAAAITVIPPIPPFPPTNVSASDGTYVDRVEVTWAASSGATSYTIYRAASLAALAKKTVLGTTSDTLFNDTTAIPGRTYYYWVKASNTYGASGFTAYNAGKRSDGRPPAPTNVSASDGIYVDRVEVTWAASPDATPYTVYRAASLAALAKKTVLGTTSDTFFNDTTAIAGRIYYYWVRASNTYGTSGFSAYNAGKRSDGRPLAPTNVSASDGTYVDRVEVTWTASPVATSYTVYRAASLAALAKKTVLGTTSDTFFNDTTAIAGRIYYYWVRASNTYGTSSFSAYNAGKR